MPSKSPSCIDSVLQQLQLLGIEIKSKRKSLGLSATVVSEASGLSRVTLHRIEKGEPSVTIGAYVAVMDAIGMSMEKVFRLESGHESKADIKWFPKRIHLEDHPQLKALAWQLNEGAVLSPQEALDIYERNWHHVNEVSLSDEERSFIECLRGHLEDADDV